MALTEKHGRTSPFRPGAATAAGGPFSAVRSAWRAYEQAIRFWLPATALSRTMVLRSNLIAFAEDMYASLAATMLLANGFGRQS